MKKKSAAKPKRKVYKTKLEVVNIKMQLKERKALQAKADRTHDGNLSALLREAGLRYVPKAHSKK